jgi:hypothetical protein|tara:strand:- start:28500 stop:28874 length:375 start_codon:yes stop_codon:yes gene_type:complete
MPIDIYGTGFYSPKNNGKLMVSAMLFNSSGHTLHEFTVPLGLRLQAQHEFRSIAGFDQTNLESMFLSDNRAAYDTTLDILAKPKSSQDISKSMETMRNNHNSISIYKIARIFGEGTKNTLSKRV